MTILLSKQDPSRIGSEESDTDEDEKTIDKPSSTFGRNGWNPISGMSAGGDRRSSSSYPTIQGHWLEEDKVFPLKKRRIVFETGSGNATEEETESTEADAKATRRKHANFYYVVQSDDNNSDDYEWGPKMECTEGVDKTMVSDALQCKRTDGRGWRCSKQPIEGHSMCENHLYKTRAANRRKAMRKHRSKNSSDGQGSNKKIKYLPKVTSCVSSRKSDESSLSVDDRTCRRWNGRTWRCSELAVEGYSHCEHHLGGSRLKNSKSNSEHHGGGSQYKCSMPLSEGHPMCENHLHKTGTADSLTTSRKRSSSESSDGQGLNQKLKYLSEVVSCFSSCKTDERNLPPLGSQTCKSWNGRDWWCSRPAVEGYSLCEHHLVGIKIKKNQQNSDHQAAASSCDKFSQK